MANNSTLADGSGMLHILAPMNEGKIIDNWDTFALRGTVCDMGVCTDFNGQFGFCKLN